MNDIQPSDDREILIDRLVDNELTDAERRELLLSFDADPLAWRQCALAFLEAQSWKSEMTDLAAESERGHELIWSKTTHGSWNPILGKIFSLAAVALITVGLTLLVRDRFVPTAPGQARGNEIAQQDREVEDSPSRQLAQDSKREGAARESQGATPEDAEREALTLLVEDSPSAPPRTVRVPLIDHRPFFDDSAANDMTPLIPEQVRSLLERMGRRVENRRRYAPIDLDDGSRVLLPVDDVHIYPAAGPMQ